MKCLWHIGSSNLLSFDPFNDIDLMLEDADIKPNLASLCEVTKENPCTACSEDVESQHRHI